MSRPLKTILTEMLKAEGVAPVALELGKSAGWVSQITHGNTIPSDEVLVKLAKKYAKSDEILGELLHAAAFARLSSQKFDEPVLRENAIAAWKSQLDAPTQKSRRTERRGTLASFPDAFYPLAVVSGDKRENSISRINVADFGAVSASPAEARWIFKLGLKRDVEFYTDKVFVLESEVQLKKRFGRKNLLLMGSPGSNQLTRRCHLATPPAGWRRAVPIFRFNALQQRLSDIEDLLKALSSFVSPQRLVGAQESPEAQRNMKFLLQNLFHGGIIDPTYRDLWLRGTALWNTDFGLISFARNPFADSDDFVCIIVAGFHMFGTAHAISMLADADSETSPFEKHPLGGVIKVTITDNLPFASKFDESMATWDVESQYDLDDVERGLHDLAKKPVVGVHVSNDELVETLNFVKVLKTRQ